MWPVCGMFLDPANQTHNPQLRTRPTTCKPKRQVPQAATICITLELLMMGIMVPETCWANSKFCNNKPICLMLLAFYFPRTPGPLWATPGLLRDSFTFYIFVERKSSSPCSMQPFIDPKSEPFLSAIQVLMPYFYKVNLKNIIILNPRSSYLGDFGKIFLKNFSFLSCMIQTYVFLHLQEMWKVVNQIT